MGAKCKHGLNPMFCATCQRAGETEAVRPDALRLTRDGKPALILRLTPSSEMATALLLEDKVGRISAVQHSALVTFVPTSILNRDEVLGQFHAIALEMGYLFHPDRALTFREQTEDGPSHCYECKIVLSWQNGSLGCSRCMYYVCRCGRCLCGYTGRNYRGELFSQYPPLPIPREERLEFVRVVRFCAGGA